MAQEATGLLGDDGHNGDYTTTKGYAAISSLRDMEVHLKDNPGLMHQAMKGKHKVDREVAFQFFKNTRPYRVVDEMQPTGYRLASFFEVTRKKATGEGPELEHFSPCNADMDLFGVGIGLYFRSLVRHSQFILICALLAMPAIFTRLAKQPNDTPLMLRGTSYGLERNDLGLFTDGFCDLLICAVLLLMAYLDFREERAAIDQVDEHMSTTKDYSVEVQNPPKLARDPDEYRDFFSKFGEVKVVTVALNNRKLLKKLSKRRYQEMQLEALIRSGNPDEGIPHVHDKSSMTRQATPLYTAQRAGLEIESESEEPSTPPVKKGSASDGDAAVVGGGGGAPAHASKGYHLHRSNSHHGGQAMPLKESDAAGIALDVTATKRKAHKDALYKQLHNSKKKITEFTSEPFIMKIHPVRVYVTFQHQASANKCLEAMKLGWSPFGLNPLTTNNENCKFDYRGRPSHQPVPLLAVTEAPEPSEIVWEHLGNTFGHLVWQFMTTSVLTVIFLLFDYHLLLWLHRIKAPARITSLLVSLFNVGAPKIMKGLTNSMEHHVYESTHEASVLIKLAAARIVNFAILIFYVIEYENRSGPAFLKQIQSLLLANCFWVPIIRNFMQFLMYSIKQRLGLSRCSSQEELNKFYMGVDWSLGERYTDLIKTLFMGVFFSPLVPDALGITAIALIIQYYTDKLALIYVWKPAPAMGGGFLNSLNRHVVVIGVFAHMLMAREVFANWPYAHESEQIKCGVLQCYTDDANGKPASWLTRVQIALTHSYSVLIFLVFYCGFVAGLARIAYNRLNMAFYGEIRMPFVVMLKTVALIVARVICRFIGCERALFARIPDVEDEDKEAADENEHTAMASGWHVDSFKSTDKSTDPDEETGSVRDAPFDQLQSAHAYVPLIWHTKLVWPLVAADMTDLPPHMLPMQGVDKDTGKATLGKTAVVVPDREEKGVNIGFKNLTSLGISIDDPRRGRVLSQVRCYRSMSGDKTSGMVNDERNAPRTMFSI